MFAGQELHGTSARPPSRRIQNALGSIVRTIIVAAVVAAVVFGGRYAYQWYQDRQAGFVAEIPAESVAPPPAQFVSFSVVPYDIDVDLATGDALATSSAGIRIAHTGGSYWLQTSPDGPWAIATDAALEPYTAVVSAIESASLKTITDVLPAEMHPYLATSGDDVTSIPGVPISGEQVIAVGDAEPASDDSTISLSGNSDAMLEDVVDHVANPAIENDAGSSPVAAEVAVRKVSLTLDGAAFAKAEPHLAANMGAGVAGTHQIIVWVDSTGVVRQMSMPESLGELAGEYSLTSATATGASPLAGIDLTSSPVVEEADS